MSTTILIPPTIEILREYLPYLTEEEISNFKRIANLMDEKIFTPIIEAENKEIAIEKELDHYFFYLTQVFTPILPRFIEWRKRPEFLFKIYRYFRVEVKKKVSDTYTRRLLFSVIDTALEHDVYTSKLLQDIDKLTVLIENAGPETYSRTLGKLSLTLNVLFIALDRKLEAVRDLSRIAKKYADELEPFVATFQVFLESELAPLREETSEQDLEKTKELRGSLLEHL